MGYHYVPQKYLDGFCNSDGWIFQYQKGSVRPPIRTGRPRVAQEPGFYPDELEVHLSSEIEKPVLHILDTLRSGQMIKSKEDREKLAIYITNMIKRTPKGWLRMQRYAPQITDKALKATEKYVAEMIKKYPHRRYEIEKQWEDINRNQDSLKGNPLLNAWYATLRKETTYRVVETLKRMVWVFYRSDQPVFLTSDNPVFYTENIGIAKAESELTLPISSYIALEATNLLRQGNRFIEARPEDIERINRRTVQNATRYIYHCEDSQEVTQFINAYS